MYYLPMASSVNRGSVNHESTVPGIIKWYVGALTVGSSFSVVYFITSTKNRVFRDKIVFSLVINQDHRRVRKNYIEEWKGTSYDLPLYSIKQNKNYTILLKIVILLSLQIKEN